jgi:hypothetical protein
MVVDFVNGTYFRSEGDDLTLVGLADPAEADALVESNRYREQVDSTRDALPPLCGGRACILARHQSFRIRSLLVMASQVCLDTVDALLLFFCCS